MRERAVLNLLVRVKIMLKLHLPKTPLIPSLGKLLEHYCKRTKLSTRFTCDLPVVSYCIRLFRSLGQINGFPFRSDLDC